MFPRIYNGNGIYNGGAGDSSSFDIVVNGVTNTLVFPAFLTPVEYIDMSEYSGQKTFTIFNAEQIPVADNKNNLFIKIAIQTSYEKATNQEQKPINYLEPFVNSNNNEIRFNIRKLPNNDGYIDLMYGRATASITPVDLSKKLELSIDVINSLYKVKEIGGVTKTSVVSSTKPSVNIGRLMSFHSHEANTFFYGRIFYAYIMNGVTNELYSLVIPARSKDQNDNKPYMVECVSGTVGCNYGPDLTTSGVQFGSDIALDDIGDYIT